MWTPHPSFFRQATFFLRKRAPFCRLRDISPVRGITSRGRLCPLRRLRRHLSLRARRGNSLRLDRLRSSHLSRLPARSALLPSEIWSSHSLGARRDTPYFFTSAQCLHLPPAAAFRFALRQRSPPETRAPKGEARHEDGLRRVCGRIKKRHGYIRALRDQEAGVRC